MGAFVTEPQTDDIEVPCPCRGTPHDKDVVNILREFTGYQISRIASAMFAVDKEDGSVKGDIGASNLLAMTEAVKGWTFVDDNGALIPFNPDLTNQLRSDIWRIIHDEVDKRLEGTMVPLGEASEGSIGTSSGTGASVSTLVPKVYSSSSRRSSRRSASKAR
jgi:hypothetical protein